MTPSVFPNLVQMHIAECGSILLSMPGIAILLKKPVD